MHSCDHCGKTFSRKTSLMRHKEGRCKYGQPLLSYGVKTSQSTSKWSVTGTLPINEFESTLGQKRSRFPNFNGADKETDQPNIIMESRTRASLDVLCHHQIIFCRANLKLNPPPPYDQSYGTMIERMLFS